MRAAAFSILAQARLRSGDVEGAAEAAGESSRLGTPAAPYLALADIAESQGRIANAFDYLRTARGLDPADLNLLMRFARLAARVGEVEDGRAALVRASELAPERADIAAALVEYDLQRGDLFNAALGLSRFLEVFPDDPRLGRLAQHLQRARGG
jgi:Flp pilus assembly protein TadD